MTDNEIQFRRFCAGFLAENHICADCEQRGKIHLANKAYLTRQRTHPGERLTLENCLPLCSSCYSRRPRAGAVNEEECTEMVVR